MDRIASVTCEYELSCAHKLENLPKGHKCLDLHGHNYIVELEFTGIVKKNGFVVDYADVTKLWLEKVHCIVDHKYLNNIDGLENPTCENLAYWITEKLDHSMLSKISIKETGKFGVTVRNPMGIQEIKV